MSKIPIRQGKGRIPYTPRFSDPVFTGYVINVVKKVFPRLASSWEFGDLVQEAAVVFLVCRERYSGKVDNPAWFMSLFARALYWHFIDLQRANFTYISMSDLSERDEPATERHDGFYWRMLQELPEDMKDLLKALGLGDDSVLPALKARVCEFAAGNEPLKTKEI